MDLGGFSSRWGYVDRNGQTDYMRRCLEIAGGDPIDDAPILNVRCRGRVILARLEVWPWVTANEENGHLPRGWNGGTPARGPQSRDIVRVLNDWLVRGDGVGLER